MTDSWDHHEQFNLWKDKVLSDTSIRKDFIAGLFYKMELVLKLGLGHGLVVTGGSGEGKSFLMNRIKELCPFPIDYVTCQSIITSSDIMIMSKLLKKQKGPRFLILDDINVLTYGPNQIMDQLVGFVKAKHPDNKLVIIALAPSNHSVPPQLLISGRLSLTIPLSKLTLPEKKILLYHLLQSIFPADWIDEMVDDMVKLMVTFGLADVVGLVNKVYIELTDLLQKEGRQNNIPSLCLLCEWMGKALLVKKIRSLITSTIPSSINSANLQLDPTPFLDWDEVIGQDLAKLELKTNVIQPIRHLIQRTLNPNLNLSTITLPRGILLHGPSGSGKSMLIQALRSELPEVTVRTVDTTQLISKLVGKSERSVSDLFHTARTNGPTLLVLDHIEVLLPDRATSHNTTTEGSTERIVSTFLTELDGIYSANFNLLESLVIVVGITQRPELVDPAMLRPGRLELHLPFSHPAQQQRSELLSKLILNQPFSQHIAKEQISQLTELTDGHSFADLAQLCRDAALLTLRKSDDKTQVKFQAYLDCLNLSRSN